MKRFIALSLALVMMLAMFAGCSSKETTTTTAAAGGEATTAASGTPSTEGKNVRTDLVMCQMADVVTLDPPESTDSYSNTIINLVFDTLIDMDENSQFIPGLAESWEVSEDGKTIVFQIRENVKFHNGETLTPSDVKFSLDRAKYEIAQSKAMLESVEEILCDDEAMTVTLKMVEPSAAILVNLTEGAMHIQNQKFVEEHPDDINQHACGTGPMMLEEWHINDYVMLKRFDEHWAGTPVTTSIKVRVIPEPTSRTIALEAGEIDWLAGVNSIDIARVTENEDLVTREVPGSSIVYISFNHNKAPFDNKLVRQALHHAADKESMIQVVYEGYALPGESPFPNIMPFWKSNPYEYNLETAKALLAEAGYPDGLGRTIELGVSSDERNRMAQIFQADCAKIGVDIKIELMEFGALMEHCDGNQDLIMLGWGHATNQDRTMRMNFHSSTIGPNGNRSWLNNPEIDALIDAGAVEMDQEKREKIYHELQDVIAEEVPWIPLLQQITVYGMNKGLEGITWYNRGGGYYANGYVVED
ncbi:MAG: ABC transporter substrate-binding protein [Lachnospiraceae bacterium]|nr:ABC transporter substrate-binding protein [Lachnospiraceae bacterium]